MELVNESNRNSIKYFPKAKVNNDIDIGRAKQNS